MPVSLEGINLGKYRVLESLGRGGMARVYRAYHPQLDRYVAIKVMRPDLVEEEAFLLRFRREAQAVAGLRHANVVQVFDFDVQEDVYYMVMELLEGDTLKARLRDYGLRDERMPLGDMVRVLLDVLDGLAYAHSEGMIHRDIKPANIMLTKRGQAVVADFGITQIVGGTRHTVSGALMGTLDYMAPEQGLENQCDARSDVYSLGIVFYEMLTQRTPFDADTPLAVLMKHLNDPLPLPRQIEPSIPEPLERVVLKALAKSPEDRYQSAEEMGQALRRAAEEAEIELPARISLPLSFRTPAAPAESVAVFSGSARQRIPDAEVAEQDTDVTLGERLEAERSAQGAAEAGGAKAPAGSRQAWAGAGAAGVLARLARSGRGLIGGLERASRGMLPPLPESLGRAILAAAGINVLGNLGLTWVAGLTGLWGVFEKGWPAEILWFGLGICLVAWATGSVWILAPGAFIVGQGVLFIYYALTNLWDHWLWLWPVEPLMVAGTVWLVMRLSAQDKGERRQTVRLLSWALVWLSVGLSLLVVGVAFLAELSAALF